MTLAQKSNGESQTGAPAMHVLMADDDAALRHGLGAQLRRWGYEPIVCSDGNMARSALQADPAPLVVILDRNMPGTDGLTLCHEIRASPRLSTTYVILLTAQDSRDEVMSGLGGGADEYITKPFDWQMLQARLAIGVRIATLQQALASRVADLQTALADVKRLSGLLPMCSYCKRIRNDQDYWQQLESYLSDHSEAQFSHGYCPECLDRAQREFESS